MYSVSVWTPLHGSRTSPIKRERGCKLHNLRHHHDEISACNEANVCDQLRQWFGETRCVPLLLLVCIPLIIASFVPVALSAQPEPISPSQLDQLVARIALYPDPLLAQVLTTSTYWSEIPAAAVWADQHSYLKGDALAQAIQADHLQWAPVFSLCFRSLRC
jgi:hypothetical protein